MVAAKCRGSTGDNLRAWEADNRGGDGNAVVDACRGCTVMRECARYGLATGPGGMVWAGVPVPEMPHTSYYARAIARLNAIANSGPAQ
ncbi:WhiB family transcriptional regulator [Nocardia puris]|nr:WhiB family transcriptional regulator [Nocardia puris]